MILQTSSKDRVCCFDVHKSRAQAGLLTRFVKLQAHANQVRSPLSIWQGLTRLTCVCISISLTRHTWLMTLELTTLTIYHTLHTLHTRNTLPTLLTLPTLPTLPHYTLVYDFYTLYYSIYTFYIYILHTLCYILSMLYTRSTSYVIHLPYLWPYEHNKKSKARCFLNISCGCSNRPQKQFRNCSTNLVKDWLHNGLSLLL